MADILCIFVIFDAIRTKQYRYIFVALLTICYLVVHEAYAIGGQGMEQVILLTLFFCTFLTSMKRSQESKRYLAPAVLSGAAFVVRVLWSVVYHWFIGKMKLPGSDPIALHKTLSDVHIGINVVISILLLASLVSIIIHLNKVRALSKANAKT